MANLVHKGYSTKEIEAALRRAGATKEQAQILTAISGAESSYGANPYGDKGLGGTGYTSFGPFQVHTPAHPQYDPGKLVTNLDYSARAAVEVFKGSGYGAWTTYKTGAWKSFFLKDVSGQGGGGNTLEKAEGTPGSKENIGPVEAVKGAVNGAVEAGRVFAEVGTHIVGWIAEPLTPIKFLGGTVLLYIGVRTLTGGGGAAREASRAISHAREVVPV